MATKTPIGKITHFFPKIGVAVLSLTGSLKVGDTIEIGGKSEPFQMLVESMQVEHKSIAAAKKGDDVGMKVPKPVKDGDQVFKIA